MKDIAERLGVSQATVSHVLRGRNEEFRISAETAARIQRAAEEMGYRPSALARNFKDHRAYSLCLAVGDLTNPFWAGLAMAAQKEAESHGYTLVVSSTGDTEEKERQLVDLLRDRRVDGLILSPAHHKPRTSRRSKPSGSPSYSSIARSMAWTCRRSSPTASPG